MPGFLKKIWDPRLLHPVLYKATARFAIGAAAALLWDHFINKNVRLSPVDYAFPIIGAIYAAAAWFSYLSLDGVGAPRFIRLLPKKHAPKRRSGDISDFTEEELHPFEALDPSEQTLCRLTANALCAALFWLTAMLSAIF